jgi:hypothetical protein
MNLIGRRFGRLTVVEDCGSVRTGAKSYRHNFRCVCECGKILIVSRSHLTSGHTKSCGCLRAEIRVTHGQSDSHLYHIWEQIKQRCCNQNDKKYINYGGRGIYLCDEWQSFKPFASWSYANGYREDLSIDRINNDDGYRPGNCRWATRYQQMNNTSRNVRITFNGKTQTLAQWSRETGLNYRTLHNRLFRSGWPVEKALEKELKIS